MLALCTAVLLVAYDSSADPEAESSKVIGLYSVPADACSLVAEAGFNVVHSYVFETREWHPEAYIEAARTYLNEAHRWHLQVLLGLPRSWARSANETSLQQVIRSLSGHPALFAWYEEEMFLNGDLASVQLLHRVVQENDPVHGLVIEESRADARLLPLGRHRMFTWYPVTDKARRDGRMISVEKRFPTESFARKPWPSLQAFGRDRIEGYDDRDFLEPSWRELQYSLYASLITGAPAVFFYSYQQPTRYDAGLKERSRWPWGDYKALPDASPELWRITQRAVGEWKQIQAWIGQRPQIRSLAMPHAADIRHAQWEVDAGLLLVVSNASYTPKSPQIAVDGHRRYRVLQATGLSGWQEITDGVLRLELPGPGGIVVLLD